MSLKFESSMNQRWWSKGALLRLRHLNTVELAGIRLSAASFGKLRRRGVDLTFAAPRDDAAD